MRKNIVLIVSSIISFLLSNSYSVAQFDQSSYQIWNTCELDICYDYWLRGWGDLIPENNKYELLSTGKFFDGITFSIVQSIWSIDGSGKIDLPVHDSYFLSYGMVDYDNDGDLDLFTTGNKRFDQIRQSTLYKYIGDSTFISRPTDILHFGTASQDWNDFDHDGDYDLLISGITNNYGEITKIYQNENGIFSEYLSTLEYTGVVRWLNLDNDDRIELIIDNGIFYINAEDRLQLIDTIPVNRNVPLDALDIGDFDMDGDQDLAIWSQIVQNDNSNFSVFADLVGGNPKFWGDFDNDGDLDLFYGSEILNNESGVSFSTTSFNWFSSSSDMVDFDMDGDLDIYSCTKGYPQYVYNNGSVAPNHKPNPPTNLSVETYNDSIRFFWDSGSDFETDSLGLSYNIYVGSYPGGCDIMSPMADVSSGKRYILKQGNVFQSHTYYLKDLPEGEYFWGVQSVDNHYAGSSFATGPSFSVEKFKITLEEVTDDLNKSMLVFDADNDNDLDLFSFLINEYALVIVEYNNSEIYQSFGHLRFPSVPQIVDFKMDGLLDLLFDTTSVQVSGNLELTNIVHTFPYANTTVDTIARPQIHGIDFNNDLLWDSIAGDTLYYNTGNGFEEYTQIKGANRFHSWCDFDNDGDLDIAAENKIYRNDFSTFSMLDVDLSAYPGDGMLWSDFDNDGNADILFYNSNPISIMIFYNKGDEVFIPFELRVPEDKLVISGWDVTFGDLDNDLDVDMFQFGHGTAELDFRLYTYRLTNNATTKNTAPYEPQNLSNSLSGFDMLISWNAATDNQQGSGGLTYNIRVGTTPGGVDIISPLSDPVSGYRRVPWIGNVGTNLNWRLEDLDEGTYYWSVQAIDHSYIGGPWAPEKTFSISRVSADFIADTVCLGAATHFYDTSIAAGATVNGWLWDFGDGTSDTAQHPVHVFDSAKVYSVTLTAYADSFSHSITKEVLVKHSPHASFTVPTVCENTKSDFTDLSNIDSITIQEWIWEYGYPQATPTIATEQVPGGDVYPEPGDYTARLIITAENGCSDTATSNVTVAEYPDTVIYIKEGNRIFCDDTNAVLEFRGKPYYTYRWIKDGGYVGDDVDTLFVDQPGQYSVEVNNPVGGCNITTEELEIIVNQSPGPPDIIATPGSAEACRGDSVVLYVPHSTDLIYQWRFNGSEVGSDTSVLFAWNEGLYTLSVQNAEDCETQSSNSYWVTINDLPALNPIEPDGSRTFCEGSSVTFSADTVIEYQYRWQQDGIDIPGAIGYTYTADESGWYRLVTKDTATECEAISNSYEVTTIDVAVPPVITPSSQNTTFCYGESITLSTTHRDDYIYAWKRDGGNVDDGDSSAITVTEEGPYWLEMEVPGQECTEVVSNTINIDTLTPPPLPILSKDGRDTLCQGESCILSTSWYPGNLYRWKRDGDTLTGEWGQSITVWESGLYTVYAENNQNGCFNESEAWPIHVYPLPDPPPIRVDDTTAICRGDTAILSVTEDPFMEYSWQLREGKISSDHVLYAIDEGTYTLLVTDIWTRCSALSADTIEISLFDLPERVTPGIKGDPVFCQGDSCILWVELDPAMDYQWIRDNNPLAESTENQLIIKKAGYYRLEITNEFRCSVITAATEIMVNLAPVAPTIIASDITSFCRGTDTVRLSVNTIPGISYTWIKDDEPVAIGQSSYTATTSGVYRLQAENELMCSTLSTDSVTVEVKDRPEPSDITLNQPPEICDGDILIMSLEDTVTGYKYQWIQDGAAVTGGDDIKYETSVRGTYWVQITDEEKCDTVTEKIVLEVYGVPPVPVITLAGEDSICEGGSITINVTNPTKHSDYHWFKDRNLIRGVTQSKLSGAYGEGEYYVIDSIGSCFSESASLFVYPKSTPAKPSIEVGGGPNIWYLASSVTDAMSYQWYFEGQPIEGATDYIYVAGQNLGKYALEITREGFDCPSISEEIRIPLSATGIEEIEANQISIYPNPNEGSFILQIRNSYLGRIEMRLVSPSGTLILNEQLEKRSMEEEYEFQWEYLDNGVYIIELTFDRNREIRRLFKY